MANQNRAYSSTVQIVRVRFKQAIPTSIMTAKCSAIVIASGFTYYALYKLLSGLQDVKKTTAGTGSSCTSYFIILYVRGIYTWEII